MDIVKEKYLLNASNSGSIYPDGHFPRKFVYLRDAKRAGVAAKNGKCSGITIEYSSGERICLNDDGIWRFAPKREL